jgi:hypothetical protein
MYISRLSIENSFGIKGVIAFEPGMVVTIVSGGNRVGKTSILESLAYVFEGGYDPKIIYDFGKPSQAKRSVIEYDLRGDDGNLVATVRKTTTPKGGELEIADANSRPIEPPKTYINSLAKLIAIDPSRLLAAPQKDFIKVLLQVMPLSFDVQSEIVPAVPNWTDSMKRLLATNTTATDSDAQFDSDGIRKLRDAFFQERTLVNRQKDEADKTVKTLNESIAPDDGTDWQAQYAKLQTERLTVEKDLRDGLNSISLEEANAAAEIDRLAEEAKTRMRADMNERRAALRTQKDPVLKDLDTQVGVAKQKAEQQIRGGAVKDEIERANQKYSRCTLESEYLSMAITAIEDLEKRKLAELPIPGLGVRQEGAYYDGVPWDQVNTAERTRIVIQICALLHVREGSKLSFVFLDGSESLDNQNWLALQNALRDAGFLQMLAVRRSEGPLTLEVMNRDGKLKPARAAKPTGASLIDTAPERYGVD